MYALRSAACRLLALVFLATVVPLVALAQPAPVPVEAFFSPAKLQRASMSPNGRWLAALTSIPGRRLGFMMIDLDGKEASRFIEASPKDDVAWFTWVSDDWIACGLNSPGRRSIAWLGDGLLALRRDGSSSRLLIAREFEIEDPFSKRRYLEPDHAFLALGAPGTTEVIVGHWQFRNREFSHITLKAVDVATGAVRSLPSELPQASAWQFDAQGRPRLAWSVKEGQTTVYWADKLGKWSVLRQSPTYERPFDVLAVDGDEGLLVSTAAAGDGSMEIRRYDFAAKAPGKQAIVATPGFDTGVGERHDRRTGELLGLTLYTDASAPLWFKPEMKALQDKADAKFPGSAVLLYCQPCDGKARVVAFVYSDTDPGNYVLYHPQTDKWQLLGAVRPDIDPRQMQATELHRTKARDGRDLPVWVTRPRQSTPGPAPAVVLVHGGPWERGRFWSWSSEAQFLASRGYVVIEPEFRGSTGYGEDHARAGWKDWGGGMQDDLVDALGFAAKQGWADSKRACIMGGSYGGYAAMMGLVKDPDLYRCGIAYAGVSDPRNMFDFHWNNFTQSTRQFDLPVLMGDRVKDDAKFAANSPLVQAARIKAPLLLSHGGRDRRVPIDNSERMLDALQKAGKTVEWVSYPEEDHGFFFDENRIDYYRRVEAFLAKHLKP